MVEFMKKVAQSKGADGLDLSLEERNLLSVAYKNVVGARRASLRIILSLEQKEKSKGESEQTSVIVAYKKKVADELTAICNDILDVLENNLIKEALSAEPKVFYQKMKADYFRYLAEFADADTKEEPSKNADEA